MGMGEPLDNEANLGVALAALNAQAAFGLASRKITVSTIGEPAKLRRLAELGLQVNLAVSLHAASDELRGKLVPGQRGVPVAQVVDAARAYFRKTGREVTFEYVLVDRVNDSDAEASRLARLLEGFRCKVNLIPLNPVGHNRMQPPRPGQVRRFGAVLSAAGLKVTVRHSQGQDILAACGQLAAAGYRSEAPENQAGGARERRSTAFG
jgi:23S rRNA (adenine2503-C2)-methyltransferase